MPKVEVEYHAGYPRRATYQRRGARVHWFLVTNLGECIARGDEKNLTAAQRAAMARRKELVRELRASYLPGTRKPIPRSEIKPSCSRERHGLDQLR